MNKQGLTHLALLWGCVTVLVWLLSAMLERLLPQAPELLRTAMLTGLLVPLMTCWLGPCLGKLTRTTKGREDEIRPER